MIKKIIILLIVVTATTPCFAQCHGYTNKPIKIEVIKDYGDVVLNDTLSREDFDKYAGRAYHHHKDTTGLTVATFNMSVEATGTQVTASESEYSCVYLDLIRLYLAYEDIHVLIDNKYKKGSCQYSVILEHEKKHVAVHKKSLDYYAPYISGAMEKAAREIGPRIMKNSENVEDVLAGLSEDLMYEVSDMLDFFERERDKANARLDTNESYEKERSLCDSW